MGWGGCRPFGLSARQQPSRHKLRVNPAHPYPREQLRKLPPELHLRFCSAAEMPWSPGSPLFPCWEDTHCGPMKLGSVVDTACGLWDIHPWFCLSLVLPMWNTVHGVGRRGGGGGMSFFSCHLATTVCHM